ncbi:Glycosyltransferase family 25 (LPS biosynthesis protein) [Rubritalea squalenifaciens DSM 18772]|uniref:Glycosyltransferase family 25 (LPS biosynthesis protein) n=1 Tax=Rubritalea squalenifaciens DSM 18772 TaxID=1123071 RepID=A0A1M6CPL3_9BACT|nr:Glycosyltransferase family 25 (LPS biosynthesis protein) [Rubritalea squalenifaciens DSM 18772]
MLRYNLITTQGSSRLRAAFEQAERLGYLERLMITCYPRLAEQFPDRPQQATELGNVGCFAAHRRAIENLHELGHEYAVVLEDDCVFASQMDCDAVIEGAILELNAHDPEWRCLNLGGCRFDQWVPGFRFYQQQVGGYTSRVRNMTTTHAMVYHIGRCQDLFQLWVPSYEEVLEAPDDFHLAGLGQDLWLSRQAGFYALNTPIAFQTGNDTTIGNLHQNIDQAITLTHQSFQLS